jgi:alanine-synthesizing transaminase
MVDADHLVLTASSSESYSLLFKLLANPGDEVLVPTPSYPLFEFLAHLDGVVVRTYPLHFDHEWHLSVDTLDALITDRTRAVVLVHPNNPTGSFLKRAEATALLEVCARHGRRGDRGRSVRGLRSGRGRCRCASKLRPAL